MSRKISKDLTQGKVINVLLEFAWPIMLSNLVQTAYSMADMAIIGRFGSDVALAAVSNGTSVGNLFVNTASGFATAGQVITAQNMSKKDSQRMNDIIGTLFSFVAVFGILFTIICLALKPYLMNWLNVPQQAYDQSSYYIIVTAVGLLFIFGYHMVSGILRGLGNSKKPMQYITIAAVLNVLFDIIFIGYFHLEALGAALATVLAQGSAFVLCLIYLYRNREAFGFDFRVQSFRLRPEYLREMIVLGIPIAFQSLSGSFSTLYVSSLVNPYGIAASAITGVGSKLASIALIVANSLNVSAAAMIGQCYGQKNAARIRKIFLMVFAIDFTYVTLLSLAVLKYPVALFSLFNRKPEVLEMSAVYAPTLALSFMSYAFRSPSLGFVNGTGNSKVNLLMGFVEGFVLRMGLCSLAANVFNLGLQGIWFANAAALFGYGVVVFPYFLSGIWKRKLMEQ